MWKYVWFLSATPYGLLLFIIQIVAAAVECENEFSWRKNGLTLGCHMYFPQYHQWFTRNLHMGPFHESIPFFINISEVHCSIHFHAVPLPQPNPTQPGPARDHSVSGTWTHYLELLATEVFTLGLVDRWQLPEKWQWIFALLPRVASCPAKPHYILVVSQTHGGTNVANDSPLGQLGPTLRWWKMERSTFYRPVECGWQKPLRFKKEAIWELGSWCH